MKEQVKVVNSPNDVGAGLEPGVEAWQMAIRQRRVQKKRKEKKKPILLLIPAARCKGETHWRGQRRQQDQ